MKERLQQIGNRIMVDIKNYKMAFVLFFAYYYFVKILFHAYCPMILISGLPCPGCGMTRAIFLFFQGEWKRSFDLQPLAVLWIAFGGYCITWRYLLGKKIKGLTVLLILLLSLLIGVYLYRMMTVFPSYAPMTYRNKNVLSSLIPGYKEFLRIFWKV